MDKCCCAPAPDRSGRECNKPLGHDGDHWTYGGNEKTWPQDRTVYLEKQIDRLLVDVANLRDDKARWIEAHDEAKADLDKTRLAWAEAADERDLRRGERDQVMALLDSVQRFCPVGTQDTIRALIHRITTGQEIALHK